MTNTFSGPLPGNSLKKRPPTHLRSKADGPLITPVEVPLYLFLVYLTFFVYSNVLL